MKRHVKLLIIITGVLMTCLFSACESLIRAGMNAHELPGLDKVPVYHIQNQIFAILT